jgi:hypothetical protein
MAWELALVLWRLYLMPEVTRAGDWWAHHWLPLAWDHDWGILWRLCDARGVLRQGDWWAQHPMPVAWEQWWMEGCAGITCQWALSGEAKEALVSVTEWSRGEWA